MLTLAVTPAPDPTVPGYCPVCETVLPARTTRTGRPRLYCSDACQKLAYDHARGFADAGANRILRTLGDPFQSHWTPRSPAILAIRVPEPDIWGVTTKLTCPGCVFQKCRP